MSQLADNCHNKQRVGSYQVEKYLVFQALTPQFSP